MQVEILHSSELTNHCEECGTSETLVAQRARAAVQRLRPAREGKPHLPFASAPTGAAAGAQQRQSACPAAMVESEPLPSCGSKGVQAALGGAVPTSGMAALMTLSPGTPCTLRARQHQPLVL